MIFSFKNRKMLNKFPDSKKNKQSLPIEDNLNFLLLYVEPDFGLFFKRTYMILLFLRLQVRKFLEPNFQKKI